MPVVLPSTSRHSIRNAPPGVRGTILGAGVAVLIAAAVACGADEGSNAPEPTTPKGTRVVIVATFTPVPPDYTPEIAQTRSAQQTAYAQTATAQPPTTPTAPPPITIPSGPGPLSTASTDQIKPPDAVIQASGGQAFGSIGSFNWFSTELQAGADVDAPYIFAPDSVVSWANGTAATITIPNTPFAVVSTELTLFPYDENMVIPTNPNGQVIGDRPAFLQRTEPAQRATTQGPAITLQPSVAPGRYILLATVNFQTPAELPDQIFVVYAFAVEVL